MRTIIFSEAMRAELDALDMTVALTAVVQHLAERHDLLKSGQRKLVAVFDHGELRKCYVTFGMGPDAFDGAADGSPE